MKRKLIISAACLLLSVFFSHAYSQTKEIDLPAEKIKVRVEWEKAENAIKYKILIRNADGKLIINTDTESNSIELEIPEGEYSMRIGSVNKFNKIGSWSEWASITVRKTEKPVEIAGEKEKAEKELAEKEKQEKEKAEAAKAARPYTPLKFGIGGSYYMLLPEYDKFLDNSFISGNIVLGYGLGKVIPAKFFRYTGLEIEADYAKFEGKDTKSNYELNKTDILAGGNIYFTTAFNFPVNFIIRGGGGIALTNVQYKDKSGSTADVNLNSQDPYFKFGAAIEITPFSHFFIETGAEYSSIMYIGDAFNSYRFFGRLGVRF